MKTKNGGVKETWLKDDEEQKSEKKSKKGKGDNNSKKCNEKIDKELEQE